MIYTIYQLPVEHDNCFRQYEFAMTHGGVNISDYKTVWTGEIKAHEPVMEVLESIYFIFNMAHPEGYTGRSLSVSDLVTLEDGRTFFVDLIGFKKLN